MIFVWADDMYISIVLWAMFSPYLSLSLVHLGLFLSIMDTLFLNTTGPTITDQTLDQEFPESGNPWFKKAISDETEIDDSFPILKFEKVTNANQHSLIVKNCLKSDFTIYTARCTNEAGETEEYQASLSEVPRNSSIKLTQTLIS